jgi:hypothetical protein
MRSSDPSGSLSASNKGAPYPLKDTEVFLQGSYKNDTNVYGDSDVDTVLCHTGTFFKDLNRLSPADRAAYDAATGGTVQYGYNDFKRDATAYITRLYNNVNVGRKGGNSGRRNADVLIASAADGTHKAFYASLADLACLPSIERLVCRCAIASHFGHDRAQSFRCSSAAHLVA